MSTAVAEPDDDAAPLVAAADADPEEIVGYVRSASDVLRLFTFGVLALLLLALARWAQEGLLGVERDLVGLFEFVSPAAERLLAGAGQIAQFFIFAAQDDQLGPEFLAELDRFEERMHPGGAVAAATKRDEASGLAPHTETTDAHEEIEQ